jgi:hypothetical protein
MFLFFDDNILRADAAARSCYFCHCDPDTLTVKEEQHCLEMEQVSALDASL